MISRNRALEVICALGLLLSVSGAVYASFRFIDLSSSIQGIAALGRASDEALVNKAASFVTDAQQSEFVRGELMRRHEVYSALHQTLVAVIDDARARAVNELLLWIAAVIVFGILYVRVSMLGKLAKSS
jgi:hypothetical protein